MSDTLQERESETTTACECGRLGHSEQVRGLPKGARVKAITDIAQLGENVRIGTKGTVTGHCSDGRAIIFFDGFPHGHTFHTPNGYIDLLTDQTATTDYCSECKGQPHAPWCSEFEPPETEANQLLPDGISSVSAGNEHQPAARGGGDEVQRDTRMVIVDLVGQRERLLNALWFQRTLFNDLRNARTGTAIKNYVNNAINSADTVLWQFKELLTEYQIQQINEQRSTSE